MKLYSWARRKLVHKPATKQHISDADPIHSVETPPLQNLCPRFNSNRELEISSRAMRLSTNCLKGVYRVSKPYFQKAGPLKVSDSKEEVQSMSVEAMYNKQLMMIGTIGTISGLLRGKELEELMSETERHNHATADPEESSLEVLKLQDELRRIFYIIEDGEQLPKNFRDRDDHAEQRESGDISDQKGEKKLFPLQKFLEIPLEAPAYAIKKNQMQFVRGLSNLFSCIALPRKLLHHTANESAKRIGITPCSRMEKLLKSKLATGHPRYLHKIDKFLQLLRKMTISDNGRKGDAKEDGDRAKLSRGRGSERYIMSKPTQSQEEADMIDGLKVFGSEDRSSELELDDVQVWKTVNEYWINTDDEYVVLEL